ncbi:hypothetical protein FGO68_gene12256 [Halteria grandinella]|uniref:Uncharacterized protein n=1 Tax=Halteria grandinella TaxID=5974 RepID=A0A8J8SWD2_HALGN|nr:hypothetical protein FGO68_gene12256 [Halteria grandinella]
MKFSNINSILINAQQQQHPAVLYGWRRPIVIAAAHHLAATDATPVAAAADQYAVATTIVVAKQPTECFDQRSVGSEQRWKRGLADGKWNDCHAIIVVIIVGGSQYAGKQSKHCLIGS